MSYSITDLGGVFGVTTTSISLSGLTVPAGSLICALAQCNGDVPASFSITDGAGNIYGQIGTLLPNGAATANGALYYVWNCAALSGASISFSHGSANNFGCSLSAFYATGVLAASDPHDAGVDVVTTGSGTSESCTSGAPAGANELFVAASCYWSDSTFNQDTGHGWGAPFTPVHNSLVTMGSAGGTLINVGSGAKTYAPTTAAGVQWAVRVAAFKPASEVFVPYAPMQQLGPILAQCRAIGRSFSGWRKRRSGLLTPAWSM